MYHSVQSYFLLSYRSVICSILAFSFIRTPIYFGRLTLDCTVICFSEEFLIFEAVDEILCGQRCLCNVWNNRSHVYTLRTRKHLFTYISRFIKALPFNVYWIINYYQNFHSFTTISSFILKIAFGFYTICWSGTNIQT